MYIDDAALNIPLVYNDTSFMCDSSMMRPYVSWVRMSEMLWRVGILSTTDLEDSELPPPKGGGLLA